MDIYHDQEYIGLARLHEAGIALPPYVAEYGIDKEAAESKLDKSFADPDRRMFPIDSPSDAWLSSAYFSVKEAEDRLHYTPATREWVRGNIKRAAAAFGILEDIERLESVILGDEEIKSASDDGDNYLWKVRGEDGRVRALRYPVFDAEGVYKAAEYFMENREAYPQCVRTEICTGLLKKAEEHGASDAVTPAIEREAGMGVADPSALGRELAIRGRQCNDPEIGMLVLKAAEMVACADGEELYKSASTLVEMLDRADRLAGLKQGRDVMFPADTVYALSEKEASELLNDVVEVCGVPLSATKLAELDPTEAFVPLFGSDFVPSVGPDYREKLAENVRGLTADDARMLVRHLSAM